MSLGHSGNPGIGGDGVYSGPVGHHDDNEGHQELPVPVILRPPPPLHGQNPYEILTTAQMHGGYREDGYFHDTALIQLQKPESTHFEGDHDGPIFTVPIRTELTYPGEFHYRRCKGSKCKIKNKNTYKPKSSIFDLIPVKINDKPQPKLNEMHVQEIKDKNGNKLYGKTKSIRNVTTNDKYFIHNGKNSIRNGNNSIRNGNNSIHNDNDSIHNGINSINNGKNSIHNDKNSIHNGKNSIHNGKNMTNNGAMLIRNNGIQLNNDTSTHYDYSKTKNGTTSIFNYNNRNGDNKMNNGTISLRNDDKERYYKVIKTNMNNISKGLVNKTSGYIDKTQHRKQMNKIKTKKCDKKNCITKSKRNKNLNMTYRVQQTYIVKDVYGDHDQKLIGVGQNKSKPSIPELMFLKVMKKFKAIQKLLLTNITKKEGSSGK